MQVVDMKVQEVEIGGALPHFVQHQRMMRNWVTDIRIEAQHTGRARNELGGGDGIPTREECYLMTLPDQRLAQTCNHPLRSAIESWRHALEERRNLCNPHHLTPLRPATRD